MLESEFGEMQAGAGAGNWAQVWDFCVCSSLNAQLDFLAYSAPSFLE